MRSPLKSSSFFFTNVIETYLTIQKSLGVQKILYLFQGLILTVIGPSKQKRELTFYVSIFL